MLFETGFEACSARKIKAGTLVVSNHFLTAKAKRWESRPPNKNTLLRKRRMEELLARCNGRLSLAEIFAITRDRKNLPHALCNDDRKHFWMTISAQLQVIPRRAPENSVNYFCCGNTRHCFYLPAPLALEETFLPLLGGAFYEAADKLYRKHRCSPHLRKAQKKFEAAMPERSGYPFLYVEAMAIMRPAGRR